MNFVKLVYFAVRVAPIVASVATISTAVSSTVEKINTISSFWRGEEVENTDEYWELLDDGGVLRVECK